MGPTIKGKPCLIGELDAEGQSLTWRAGDLKARFMLLDRAEALMDIDTRAMCTLVHAMEYLHDRLAYELYPWPKNCVPRNWGLEEKR